MYKFIDKGIDKDSKVIDKGIDKDPKVIDKDDEGKADFSLVDASFEEGIAKVLTFGAAKYSPHSWKKLEDAEERYYAALRRHLCAYRKGDRVDSESKLSHLLHVAANCMFLYVLEMSESDG